jgi:hypothetical protein
MQAGKQEVGLMEQLGQPILVLSAFASELFLKSQIETEGTKLPRKHDLETLFGALAPDTRAAIEATWDKMMVADEHNTHRLEVQAGQSMPRDLSTALAMSKNSFQEIRYFYETNSAYSVIGWLSPALKDTPCGPAPRMASLIEGRRPPSTSPIR